MHNSSVSLDMWDDPSQDWNPPNFMSGWLHTLNPSLWLKVSLGINAYVLIFACYILWSDTEMLNSLEEFCIMQVATNNSFAKVLNPQLLGIDIPLNQII